MINASKELSFIKQFVKDRLLERMQELNVSPSELARLINSPRSTISSILSDENNRLPHLYTLIQVARALSLPIENILPNSMLNLNDNTEKGGGNFIHPKKNDIGGFLGSISKYKFGPNTYYHPRSIPEFCKTDHMLVDEYQLSPEKAYSYKSDLQKFFQIKLSGIILLDQNMLVSLLDRTGIFEGIPRHDTIKAFESLSNFENIQSGRVIVYVGDRSIWRVDPVLVISESVAVSDFFGSLLIHDDKVLISYMVEKMEAARGNAKPFKVWLSSV